MARYKILSVARAASGFVTMSMTLLETSRIPITCCQRMTHTPTPSIAFRPLPPNSARTGYPTQEALFTVSAQLSTDALNTLQKVWVLIRLWKHRFGSTLTLQKGAVCGHYLVTLYLTINDTLMLSSLPILMLESFWW